jgi:phosphate transport system substrate-binding protein
MGMTMPVDRIQARRFAGGDGAHAVPTRILPVIAGLVCWLAAVSALAQPAARTDIPRGAGESAVAPSVDRSYRKQLLIVGSTSMEAITDAIIEHMAVEYKLQKPIERMAGTKAGIAAFCDGVGVEYPDIVAASERMEPGEFETCIEHKVLDVIEVAIGQSAVVVVTKKGNPVFDVTPRMFYYAAADDIPIKGEFTPNPHKSWKDADDHSQDLPIQIIVPAQGSGTRGFFDDNFMEGGCRHVKEIDAIFTAADRVPRCITLREDGVVTEVPEPYEDKVLTALATAPPGAVAVIPWGLYLTNKDKLDLLPVSGVLPSHESVSDYTYTMATTLYYYFKRAHMRNNSGRGVVRGIREFMAEIVSGEAADEGGYFEKLGVIALAPEDHRKQRTIVRRLKRFEP